MITLTGRETSLTRRDKPEELFWTGDIEDARRILSKHRQPLASCIRCVLYIRLRSRSEIDRLALVEVLVDREEDPTVRSLIAEIIGDTDGTEIGQVLYDIAIDKTEDWALRCEAASSASKLAAFR